jgi:hypothetical protein
VQDVHPASEEPQAKSAGTNGILPIDHLATPNVHFDDGRRSPAKVFAANNMAFSSTT